MALEKYKFNPGDKLPAVNVNSIDPDNIQPQTAGYLTGGTNPSAYSVFETLRAGDNNGKIKINIDGVVYDDIDINLKNSPSTSPIKVINREGDAQAGSLNSGYFSQSFNSGAIKKILSIYLKIRNNNNSGFAQSFTLTLKTGTDPSSGTVIGSKNVVLGGNSDGITFTFDTPIDVLENTNYIFVVSKYDGYNNPQIFYSNNAYSGGSFWNGTTEDTTKDLLFSVTSPVGVITSFTDIASCVQTAIRTATGKLETVTYDTDHFVITSAHAGSTSKILKLMSPSTGTDISGAGATPYLDCGTNAVETLGNGEDYNLPRLGQDGRLPQGINKTVQGIVTTAKSLNTAYQNTTTKTKLIIVNIAVQGASNQVIDCYGKIGTTSTPDIVISRVRDGGSSYTERMTIPMTLIVPPNYYYKIETSGSYNSTPAIDNWFECDFI